MRKSIVFILILQSYSMLYAMEFVSQNHITRALVYQTVYEQLSEEINQELDSEKAIIKKLDGKALLERMIFLAGIFFTRKNISFSLKRDIFDELNNEKINKIFKKNHKELDEFMRFLTVYLFHQNSTIRKSKEEITVDTLVKRYCPIKIPFLGFAVLNDMSCMVELLCGLGANPENPDEEGNTPLSYAKKKDKLNHFKKLLQHFMKTNQKKEDELEVVEPVGPMFNWFTDITKKKKKKKFLFGRSCTHSDLQGIISQERVRAEGISTDMLLKTPEYLCLET